MPSILFVEVGGGDGFIWGLDSGIGLRRLCRGSNEARAKADSSAALRNDKREER
jgi:hypothetical protein